MRTILQGFLLFLVWASFGRWYYVCQIKKHCIPSTEEARRYHIPKTLGVYAGDTSLLRGYEQFVYNFNIVQAPLSSNNLSFLNDLTQHLQKQPEVEILITGFYLSTEYMALKSASPALVVNPGEARANQIKQWLQQKGIATDRIQIQSDLAEGQRLIEPLKFRFITHTNATAGH